MNDASSANDYYTLAPGDDGNDGLSPYTPKASVQDVLADYDLGPADLVVVDTGIYGGSTVNITSDDEGAAYAGSPAGSNFNYGGNRFELTDADFNLFYRLNFTGAGGVGIYIHPGAVNPSTDNDVRENSFTGTDAGVRIDGGSDNLVEDNLISGSGSYGVFMPSGGSATLRNNSISGRSYNVYGGGSATLVVENNVIFSGAYGIYFGSGTLTASGNEIHHNTEKGIISYTGDTAVFGNLIHDNTTGLEGYGILGGSTWSAGQFNDVYANTIGIRAYYGAVVRFNRIHNNTVGAQLDSNVFIHNNLIYRNTGQGVLIDYASNVTIENNTFYTPSGDGVRIRNNSSYITLRNNILWTAGGYDIYVATDSQQGFASDYNNLYATGGGVLVWWQKPFTDLFDWQVEADFDSHSIGYTALAPTLDDPQFVNLAGNDYHLSDVVSTSIDAGDPNSLFPLEPAGSGWRIDLGAYGNTADAAQSQTQYIRVDYPTYYTDWPETEGRAIIWHTYDAATPNHKLDGLVNIDLYQDGVGFVARIAQVSAADPSYGWYPQLSGISGDTNKRYWIKISSVGNAVSGDSREHFAVPVNSHDYYVNDSSVVNDEYCTAAGNNRNTGKTPGDPKANLLPLLRNYDLGPNDVVRIDTGNYIHVRNVLISGDLALGNDEGATFTGPTNPSKVASIDRADPYAGSTNIELNDGDFVTLKNLTLTGANMGLWVHNGSTNFHGDHLTVSNNTQDGILIESDSEATVVDALTAFNNGGVGIYIATPIASLSHSAAYNNTNTGMYLSNTGATVLEENVAYGNGTGIYVGNGISGSPTLIGNSDLAANKGNKVYNNTSVGISASSNVVVAGNTVYGQSGAGDIGIYLYGGATASNNVVFDNATGIYAYSGATIAENRVYHNSDAGIIAESGGYAIQGNTVYTNSRGIVAQGGYFSGTIANNLVYANTNQGIFLNWLSYDGYSRQVLNNTVYQPVGNAVRIEGGSRNIQLANNILWVEAGFDIYVAPDSQSGFTGDYNLLYQSVLANAHAGYFNDTIQDTLSDWQTATGQNMHSLDDNPRFVDIDGADNVLGYTTAGTGYDGGPDDNFYLKRLSPAIDRGDGLLAPPTDIVGRNRVDDPGMPNLGNTGYADIGAYEFHGDSTDATPPRVLGTTPAVIEAGGSTVATINQIAINFSEELNPIDAQSAANYELRRAVNGIFGDADDVVYVLSVVYTFDSGAGQSVATLNFGGSPLPADIYRLTVRSDVTRAIHDTAGLRLDGDGDGTEGPDYVRTFRCSGIRTWDGGSTANNLWTTKENWVDDVAPLPGDNLVFPSGTAHLESVNDYPAGTVFGSITVSGGVYQFHTGDSTSTSLEVQTGAQLEADSIVTGTLTIGAGATVTIAPIPGGPLAALMANSALTPLATRALRPTLRKPIAQPTTANIIAQSISTDTTTVAAIPLAASTVLATLDPASNEAASALTSSESLSNTYLDTVAAPGEIITDTALSVSLVETAPARLIDTAINRLPSQSPIYSWLDSTVLPKIIENGLEQSLTTSNKNFTSKPILDSLSDELPSHVSKFSKHSTIPTINNRQAHIAALQINSHWTDTEAEADLNIARHVRAGNHTKQLEKAIDEVLAEDDAIPALL